MDIDKVAEKITNKTKVIMPIDIAGVPSDYDALKAVLKEKNREDIIILCDSAHSLEPSIKESMLGHNVIFIHFLFMQ